MVESLAPSRLSRAVLAAAAAGLLTNCTFGKLSLADCTRDYGVSAAQIGAQARSISNGTAGLNYGFCGDGRRRVNAAVAALSNEGFSMDEPRSHFEVPGAFCISAQKSVQLSTYDPSAELRRACMIGEATRVVMTGGTLKLPSGEEFILRSRFERAPSASDTSGGT